MAGQIIDGKSVAEEIRQNIAQRAANFSAQIGRKPSLVALQVGHCPASTLYTDMQARSAEQVGISYELRTLHESAGEAEIRDALATINADSAVDGVILQMPLPASIDARSMQKAISAEKDVEGVHPANLGRLFYGVSTIAPCTPLSVVELLKRTEPDLTGKEVVIIGHSEIVGKPIAMMLLASPTQSPTVRICHVATVDMESHVRQADVLIVATGVSQRRWMGYKQQRDAGQNPELPNLSPLVPADWIKPGAIVIDVATNRIPAVLDQQGRPVYGDDGKLCPGNDGKRIATVGDVDFAGALEIAQAITPVPGGVGPVTVSMLLRNTLHCAELLQNQT